MSNEPIYIAATEDFLDGWVGPVEEQIGAKWRRLVYGGSHRGWIDEMPYRLNLRIPSVMDRAARVLAARVGLECGATAPGWKSTRRGWCLIAENARHRYFDVDLSIADPAEAMRLALEATR